MRIVYGVTCMNTESLDTFKNNIKLLEKEFEGAKFVLNTNHDISMNNIEIINEVKDMRDSRINLHKLLRKHDADVWMAFDSDIEITVDSIIKFKKQYKNLKNQYDFISMYYKHDSPIPAFYTLSSSLTDFYWNKLGKSGLLQQPFDDSDFESDSYQTPTNRIVGGNIKDILRGISFGRRIGEFTDKIDEQDTTTGGASIYFRREILEKEYEWKSKDGKSLTWYDSYRTFRLTQEGYKFAKVPIFVKHKRHPKSIQLSWTSVERYIDGFNLYMSNKDKNWDDSLIKSQTQELFFYSKGMVKKIKHLKTLNKDEKNTIKEIEKFLSDKKGELIWK